MRIFLGFEHDPVILKKFKKRDVHRTVGKYIPKRLKQGANTEGSQMSGHLKQKGLLLWKTNWYVLKDRVLYTYKASEDTVAIETLSVLGWTLQTVTDVSIDYRNLDMKCH